MAISLHTYAPISEFIELNAFYAYLGVPLVYSQCEDGKDDEAGGPVELGAEVSHHLEEVWTTDPPHRRRHGAGRPSLHGAA